jgi:VCBS repeat-containing protein
VVEDRTATLAQIATKFDPLALNSIVPHSGMTYGTSSLLVGRIDRNTGACSANLAAREVDTLRGTGSIFKLWVMGGVARRVAQGAVATDTPVTLVAAKKAPSAELNAEPVGTVFPLQDLASMMMGVSDNTATNLMFQVAGRDTVNQIVSDFGVANPTVLTPFLDISEQFHLLISFDLATAQNYVSGTEAFQQQFLTDQIVPLGPVTSFPYANTSLYATGTWNATPMDICKAYAALRRGATSTEAGAVTSRALSSSTVYASVRGAWDRVWFKAGSLGAADGFHVLTYSWMLEDAQHDPYVVVGMINSEIGGIENAKMQSALGRVLQLLRALPP